MKKIVTLLLVVFFLACSGDCEIDHDRISQLSDEITVLRQQQADAISQALIDNLQAQIDRKQNEIIELSNACD